MSPADSKPLPTRPPSVTEILSEEDLRLLRSHYSAQELLAGAQAAIEVPYPPAGEWMRTLVQQFMGENPLLPADRRELVILSLAVSRPLPPLFLAVHIYWGLMVGLSAQEIAATLLLSGEYSGIGHFNAAINAMMATVTALKQCVVAGTMTSSQVLASLAGALSPASAQAMKAIVSAHAKS